MPGRSRYSPEQEYVAVPVTLFPAGFRRRLLAPARYFGSMTAGKGPRSAAAPAAVEMGTAAAELGTAVAGLSGSGAGRPRGRRKIIKASRPAGACRIDWSRRPAVINLIKRP